MPVSPAVPNRATRAHRFRARPLLPNQNSHAVRARASIVRQVCIGTSCTKRSSGRSPASLMDSRRSCDLRAAPCSSTETRAAHTSRAFTSWMRQVARACPQRFAPRERRWKFRINFWFGLIGRRCTPSCARPQPRAPHTSLRSRHPRALHRGVDPHFLVEKMSDRRVTGESNGA